MNITTLLQNEAFILALGIIMRMGLAWQSELTYPEYKILMRVKRIVFPILDRIEPVGFTSFVNEKGGRDDPEYFGTYELSVKEVVSKLRARGGNLHLISSIKKRPKKHGDEYSIAHVVWTHSNNHQTEAYLFRNDNDTVDVYVHYETSVTDPEGHLNDKQSDGDVKGVVSEALDHNTE